MLGRREHEPAIDSTVMASYRHHPVNLYLAGGHVIAGGVVRHVGTRTVECLTSHGSVTVSLYAVEAGRVARTAVACGGTPSSC